MQGHIPDIFIGFEFQKDRLKSVGAVHGGRIFGFPIDLAHRLYNSLLLSLKPWYQCKIDAWSQSVAYLRGRGSWC